MDTKNIAQDFFNGEYDCNLMPDVWPKVFGFLIENKQTFKFDSEKIHALWTVNGGHLRRKTKNDNLVLEVLLKFMPKYTGKGMILYRGECRFLYDANKIGFCWSPNIDIATSFAKGLNSIESGGVLLKAYVPSHSIISAPNDHSIRQMEEYEYTCNPKLLENIQVVQMFDKNGNETRF